jgi:coenzyme F420-0:L-glutamate ligase/coenzyme F420-1:gamma-L-glutamate ligase
VVRKAKNEKQKGKSKRLKNKAKGRKQKPKEPGAPVSADLRAIAIRGIPEVRPGESVAELILAAARRQGLRWRAGDVLIIKHKIVSKAEGRIVALDSVLPSARAKRWAARTGHDARLAELALREARRVLRMEHVLITETKHGLVCANSGVDVSNVDGGRSAVLLPRDPDASAASIHCELRLRLKLQVPVIICDSFGRPWREGLTEAAIGLAGLAPLIDFRGRRDAHGYALHATQEAVADELACIAGLVCGKLENVPACVVRGYAFLPAKGSAKKLVRERNKDLFR